MDLSESPEPRRPYRLKEKEKGRKSVRERKGQRKRERKRKMEVKEIKSQRKKEWGVMGKCAGLSKISNLLWRLSERRVPWQGQPATIWPERSSAVNGHPIITLLEAGEVTSLSWMLHTFMLNSTSTLLCLFLPSCLRGYLQQCCICWCPTTVSKETPTYNIVI